MYAPTRACMSDSEQESGMCLDRMPEVAKKLGLEATNYDVFIERMKLTHPDLYDAAHISGGRWMALPPGSHSTCASRCLPNSKLLKSSLHSIAGQGNARRKRPATAAPGHTAAAGVATAGSARPNNDPQRLVRVVKQICTRQAELAARNTELQALHAQLAASGAPTRQVYCHTMRAQRGELRELKKDVAKLRGQRAKREAAQADVARLQAELAHAYVPSAEELAQLQAEMAATQTAAEQEEQEKREELRRLSERLDELNMQMYVQEQQPTA